VLGVLWGETAWVQVYILFGVPYLALDFRGAERLFVGILSLVRTVLLWIALLYTSSSRVRIACGIAGAAVHVVFALYLVWHIERDPARFSFGSKGTVGLFYGAHVSVVNFLLDVCGASIPTMRLGHVVMLAANVVCGAILAVGLLFVDSWRRGWGCYCASARGMPSRLDRGLCPQWTDFHDFDGCGEDSTANTGSQNLICRDLSFAGPKCQSSACGTGEIDTGLPRYWHLSSTILASL